MRLDDLYLWYLADPARPRLVGALKLIAVGKGVSLHYGSQWLAHGFPLSEDLPLRDIEFLPSGRLRAAEARAAGAVDDARPDRWGEKVIRFIDRPRRLSLMEYLYYAGDDRFGALGVSTGSLGGTKPKALIDIGGEEWIIKFFNGEPVDVPLVEHATMTLARRAGINTAQTRMIPLRDASAVAVRRFDRSAAGRLHCISAGTAIRAAAADSDVPPGYPELARILRRIGVPQDQAHAADAVELFRRMVFNILIDNTDDHEKNHALLVVDPFANGRLRLAPAYDVLPTGSGQGFQEFVCGHAGYDSTLENAMSQCDAFGLTLAAAATHVQAVIAVVDGWQQHFALAGVIPKDVAELAQGIDGPELRAQRRNFDPAQYLTVRQKYKPTSPFRAK